MTELANTLPPGVLTRFIDAQGHQVTAGVTRSGLLVILTRTPDEGLRGGHPALSRDNARQLGNALLAFADREEL